MPELPNGLHGAYLREELASLVGDAALRAALTDRRLLRFARSVLLDANRATEFLTRAAASLLYGGPDAALTGHSALALHGCSAADDAPIHVLVPYRRELRRRSGVVVHHGRMVEADVEEIEGLRIMALDFALAEVLCRGSRRAGIACADQALNCCEGAARAEFRAWTEYRIAERPDPRGRRQGRALLDLATGLAESPPESWTLLMLVDGGFPPPEPQFRINDISGREIYRLDLAWPELLIAVEYDGYAAHEDRQAFDAQREEDLRRRGWIVVRANAADLAHPGRLLAEVAAAFRMRGMAA